MSERAAAPEAPSRHREAGSAYIVALLALVVLTILGLTLSLVTQTEMQVGANERMIQRVFYAADSGIATSTARALVVADYSAQTYFVPEADASALLSMRNRVDVSPFYPILRAPCNLCEINNAGHYGSKQYFKINHGVTTSGTRLGGAVASPTQLAQKTLSAMVEVQPMEAAVEAYLPIDDPAELAKIKF